MKKILYICEAMGGGVRKHIIDLIKNIDKSKYDIYLMYSINRADDVFKDKLEELAKTVNLIENNFMVREINLIKDIKAFVRIKKIIQQIRPDIVHCHSSKAGALGRIVAKICGVKKIYYTPHGYIMQYQNINKYKKFLFKIIELLLSKYFTTKTLNVSNGEKRIATYNKIDKENKFKVIYNGIDNIHVTANKNKLKKELGLKEDDFIIGVAARLVKEKDPWTFFNIAKIITTKYDNVKFIYIGDGIYKKDIEKEILYNHLQDKILLLGFRNDVDDLLKIFDIYLMTSLHEGMPYSLIEALRAKLPIVATNTTGNNEVCIDGYNGLLFEVKNVNEGVKKIETLLNNKDMLVDFGEKSYNLFKEKYTIDRMIAEIEKVYEE